MDSTLSRAGRTTHLKIVVVSLAAAIVVVTIGVYARTGQFATAHAAKEGVTVETAHPASFAGRFFDGTAR